MEMAWQKRRRSGQDRAKEALQLAEKALQAANEAGSTVRNLYITFLLLGVYIGIIIASTTDRQLLLISPVTLPLLNVQLPILGFYIVAPWLFLLLHFDLLLQLYLLSDKLRVFARDCDGLPAEAAESLRKRLINFPAVQMLAGLQYDRFIQWLLALVVWITVLILPLGLLLWAQIRFLPYHSEYITWWQHAAVLLDSLMLLFFWPRLVSGQGAFWRWHQCLMFWRQWQEAGKRGMGFALGAVVVITLTLSLLVATFSEPALFHGFSLDLGEQILTANELSAEVIHDLRKGTAQQREQALQKVQGLNLQGRDLRHANLINSILPEADLRKAQLQGADLNLAQLQGANLKGAQLQGADLWGTQLQGADLSFVQLQGANLREAQLQGADLYLAQLQGANLREAQLQGADLFSAQLQGANLFSAQLRGANLKGAQLQGADLRGAYIGGALFQDANLDLADLKGLDLSPVTPEKYKNFQDMLEKEVNNSGSGKIREEILGRLKKAVGKPGTLEGIRSSEKCLSDLPKSPPGCLTEKDMTKYPQAQSDYLVKLACSEVYIAGGILREAVDSHYSTLASALSNANCEPVKTVIGKLDESGKQQLEQLQKR